MTPIVSHVGRLTPVSFFRLVGLTIGLLLWLWSTGHATSGGAADATLVWSDVPRPWLSLSPQAWESALPPLLALADVLAEALFLDPPGASDEEAVGPWHLLPTHGTVTAALPATLHISLRHVFLPPEPLALSSPLTLPWDDVRAEHGVRPFTLAHMTGTVVLSPMRRQALQYTLYVGAFADTFPDQLLVGARLRYTFARGEVTVGIDALQSRDRRRGDSFALVARLAPLLGGEGQMLALLRRMEQDAWVKADTSLLGLAARDVSPVQVFIKPVVHLSPNVAVFYRLNHFSLGEGWPKWTEHAVGVRVFPTQHLMLRAEALVTYLSQTSTEAVGFRLSGSFRF